MIEGPFSGGPAAGAEELPLLIHRNGFFGPGIAALELSNIFDRYWQARHASSIGAGLGLYIAKGIVEAHGGRIWADSAPKQGATFSFTLPASGELA